MPRLEREWLGAGSCSHLFRHSCGRSQSDQGSAWRNGNLAEIASGPPRRRGPARISCSPIRAGPRLRGEPDLRKLRSEATPSGRPLAETFAKVRLLLLPRPAGEKLRSDRGGLALLDQIARCCRSSEVRLPSAFGISPRPAGGENTIVSISHSQGEGRVSIVSNSPAARGRVDESLCSECGGPARTGSSRAGRRPPRFPRSRRRRIARCRCSPRSRRRPRSSRAWWPRPGS